MPPHPDPSEEMMTEQELRTLKENLAKLSGPSVEQFYRDAHLACSLEKRPGPLVIQQFVTAWRQLRKWRWR